MLHIYQEAVESQSSSEFRIEETSPPEVYRLDATSRRLTRQWRAATRQIRSNKLAGDDPFVAELERRLETASAKATLSVTAGKVLPQDFSTEIDPHQILFNDQLAENIYYDGTGAKTSYAKLTGHHDTLSHKNPDMQIAEVGAGTGEVFDTLVHDGEEKAGKEKLEVYGVTDI